ncbi:MAG: sulfotransferase domain-containing protein [Cyclobacteriaceae bacterium]
MKISTFLKLISLPLIRRRYLQASLENKIVITGEVRGGTTWLADVLSQIDNSMIIWEPMSIAGVPALKNQGFKERQFIPTENNDKELIKIFEDLYNKGKVLNLYTLNYSSISKALSAKTYIFKFTRANLSIPWMIKNLGFYKNIHILRHPCAVASSIFQRWGYDSTIDHYPAPSDKFNNLLYTKHENILKSVSNHEESIAADWCIRNMNVLDSNQHIYSVFYESLILDPIEEFTKLFNFIGYEINTKSIAAIEVPSETVLDTSPVRKKEDQVYKWKEFLNQKQIENIASICEKFSIKLYANDFH